MRANATACVHRAKAVVPAFRPLRAWLVAGMIVLMAALLTMPLPLEAQQKKTPAPPGKTEPKPPSKTEAPGKGGETAPKPAGENTAVTAPVPEARETVQADVSTRSVAITSSFTGTEIVVFGAVDNSRQASAESGIYDVVIVLEGTPTELVARRKSHVAGIWLNTESLRFVSVPSYYAIATTRPLDEIAAPNVLSENDLGFQAVRMAPIEGWETGLTTADLGDFKSAVIRLKKRDGLYVQEDYDVTFIGRSLFRASIDLPANVPVGPLVGRVYLFREGRLLSTYTAKVDLQREGLERVLHNFAMNRPFLYGCFTVLVALSAGMLASTLLKRSQH